MKSEGAQKPKTAKLSKNGKSQAIRLPKEFRFEGDEVFIRKQGEEVILIMRKSSPNILERFRKEAPTNVILPLDTLIAAHALSLGITLVTNNLKEFKRVSRLKVENWL